MKKTVLMLIAIGLAACATSGLNDRQAKVKASDYVKDYNAVTDVQFKECYKAPVALFGGHDINGTKIHTNGPAIPTQKGIDASGPALVYFTSDATLNFPNGHEANVVIGCAFSVDTVTGKVVEFLRREELP